MAADDPKIKPYMKVRALEVMDITRVQTMPQIKVACTSGRRELLIKVSLAGKPVMKMLMSTCCINLIRGTSGSQGLGVRA